MIEKQLRTVIAVGLGSLSFCMLQALLEGVALDVIVRSNYLALCRSSLLR